MGAAAVRAARAAIPSTAPPNRSRVMGLDDVEAARRPVAGRRSEPDEPPQTPTASDQRRTPWAGSDEAAEARWRAADGGVQTFEQRCQQVGRLLADAHGYLVRGPADVQIGRVGGLGYGLDDRWPRALIIRPTVFTACGARAPGSCRSRPSAP